MRTLFFIGFLILSFPIASTAREAETINKGPDLDTLEAQANYITSKNVVKKIAGTSIRLSSKPFLLGAYDLRDGIASRINEDNYNDLLDALRKNASPLANTPTVALEENTELPNGLRTPEEQISYLTAYAIARSFGKKGIPVLPASMALGLADAQTKDAPKILPEEEKNILKLISKKIQRSDNDWADNRNLYYRNEEKSYLATNITKLDVTSLDSGVQYKIIKMGTGKTPKPNDAITINYRGTLLDGTEFDNSYKRNKPDTFKLNAMIKGFTQAITQVPEGTQLVIAIPSLMAYGEKGNGSVPPYSALIFEVEFLSIKSGFFN